MTLVVAHAGPPPEEQTIGGVSYVGPFVCLENSDDPELLFH